MSNVTHMPPPPYSLEAMKGPERYGMDVIVDGHVVPNMWLIDAGGDEVEICFPGPVHFMIQRQFASAALQLAAKAMAVGAGHWHISSTHATTKSYGAKAVELK